MRTYYLFNINKYFAYFYKLNPYKMYHIIEELYYQKDYSPVVNYRFYQKFAIEYNKPEINEYIYNQFKTNCSYKRDNNQHLIVDKKYNKLVVNKNCIILQTNDIYSIFFNELETYTNNIFVCDFKNKDYFWLNSINKDRQKTYSLV